MKITAIITLNLDNAAFQEGAAYMETRQVLENLETTLAHAAQDALNGIDPSQKSPTLRDSNGNIAGHLNIEIGESS